MAPEVVSISDARKGTSSPTELIACRFSLPRIDVEELRAEIDAVLDPTHP